MSRPAWLLIMTAGIFYTIQSVYSWVGMINDDAQYVLLAQSLLQGTYRELHAPDLPIATLYPPGFPLLLVPFVWLVQPHWSLLKAIPIALTLLSGRMLWSLTGPWLRPAPRLLSLALFLLNPFIFTQSMLVMSDSLFLVFILAAFLWLRALLQRKNSRDAWLLGLLLGCAALTRSTGFVLIPVFVGALILARRHLDALIVGGVSFLMGASFAVRNFLLASSMSGYSTVWWISIQDILTPHRFIDNLNRVTNLFFVTGFLGIPLPYSASGVLINALFTALVWIALAAAFMHWKRREKTERILLVAALFTVTVFYAMHAAWVLIDIRYATPVLPLLAALAVTGGQALHDHFHARRSWWPTISIALIGFFIFRDARLILSMRQSMQDPEDRMPRETYQWIDATLPSDACLINTLNSSVRLYTGRFCQGIYLREDSEDYRYALLKHGVTHILSRPGVMQLTGLDVTRAWNLNRRWTASNPAAYRLVFQNTGEMTSVYEVVPSTIFMTAYKQYLWSRSQLAEGHTDKGLQGLDEALQSDPRLISALNAYGAASLLAGRPLQKARKRLELAVQMSPTHALAWLNLARVRHALGDKSGAQKALRQADRACVSETPQWDYLVPVVESEIKTSL